jgi:hypothetical protein
MSQSHFVRRRAEEPIRMAHTTQHRAFRQRVMFWGAMCGNGTLPLIQVTGTMTSARYIAIIKGRLRTENIHTKQELNDRVQAIWWSQEVQDMCVRLASSMPRRVALCMKSKGGYVPY